MCSVVRVVTTTTTVLAFLPAGVHAQRLMELEGIQLRASVRVVAYAAATCEIREGFAGDDQAYDPANRGQPLDVWQLDFSVYNGSGEWLDHLIARYNIASEWPPCSSWDGPRAGTVEGAVEWANASGFIQETGPNVVEPGQTLTTTTYLLVFHSDVPPQFERWSLDYNYAASPPDKGITTQGETEEPAVDLVPQAVAERGTLPAGIRVEQTCEWQEAEISREMVARSISPDKYNRKWKKLERAREDLFGGVDCWQMVRNQPGCYYLEPGYWSVYFYHNGHETAPQTWTGRCSNGKANGTGDLFFSEDQPETGEMRNGKQHGHWVEVSNEHSDWNLRKVVGKLVEEGPYIDGRKHGLWVEHRDRDGKVREILYEKGGIEKVRRWKNPDRNRDGSGWGRVATAVLGGAAIAAAGDGSELAVEAGLGFAEEVLGDGGGVFDSALAGDPSSNPDTPLPEIPGCQEFSAPALENDRQAWAQCGNAYANRCRIKQISDPSYKAKYPEVSQARIDQGIAESRAIITRSCQAITVTGSSVSDCSYCKQP